VSTELPQPPEPVTVRGKHTDLGVVHTATLEMNVLKIGGMQVHHCKSCDKYATDATIELDTPEETAPPL
jgi:hypothetical protein